MSFANHTFTVKAPHRFARVLLFLGSIASIVFLTWLMLFITGTYNTGPSVHDGMVEVDVDTLGAEVLHLNGAWRFFPDAHVAPEKIATYDGETGFMKLPGLWNGLEIGDKHMPSKGYGTFELTVVNKGAPEEIALFFPVAPIEAYRVFVNGQEAFSVGVPGTTRETTVPEYKTQLLTHFLQNKLTLTIQVASFTYQEGGYYKPILLGKPDVLARIQQINFAKDVFLLGLTAMMFLLFTLVITKNPKDNHVLACLIIMCVFSACYTSTTGEIVIRDIFPRLPFKAYYVMYYFLSTGGGSLYLFLVDSLYPGRVNSRIKMLSLAKTLVLFVIILFFDQHFIGLVATGKDILLLFELLYGMYVLSNLESPEFEGGLFVLFGSVVLVSSVMFDILYLYGITFSVHELYSPAGLVFLVLCFAVIAAKKYERTYQKAEQLTGSLKLANKTKDRFLANTSHELRTPINSTLALLTSLRAGATQLESTQLESMDMAIFSIKRLNRLVYDLLDLSGMKDNTVTLNKSIFSVRQIVELTAKELRPLLEDKSIDLELEADSTEDIVHGDKYRIIQVLYNVVGNAIKFTPENGRVRIAIEKKDDNIIIAVSDTGIGIEADKLDRIFNSFEQADASISREYGGLGLGLSISKEIMRAHDGDILVESTPNKGTTFILQLPLQHTRSRVSQTADPDTKALVSKPSLQQKGKTLYIAAENDDVIVIIDDDYANIYAAASVLKPEGYTIKGYSDEQEGLDEVVNNPHVILAIVDLMMPSLSGEELTRMVRQRYSLLDRPILILTAKSNIDGLTTCFDAGANDFLLKPFENEELKARTRTLAQLKNINEKSVENELKMLQAQIKPHFLFNAMNTISDCCYDDGEKAADMIADLSDYLRKSFQFDYKMRQIPLEDELELVRAYLSLEKARFNDKLQFEISVTESQNVRIIPFAVQLLVENAATHGVRKKKQGGGIRVNGFSSPEGYTIEVSDTGVGIAEKDIPSILNGEKYSGTGIGLANLQKRILQTYNTHLQLRSTFGVGTSVSILLKDHTRSTQE